MQLLACDRIHKDGLAMFCEAGYEVRVSDPITDLATLWTSEAAREVEPWMPMTALGHFAASLQHAPSELPITYAGRTDGLDTRPLTRLLLAALLGHALAAITVDRRVQNAELDALRAKPGIVSIEMH